ncbi:hypothetical protein ACIPWI_33490 [Streptomyces sp. NPDC090046]|uniref:hypothetical protein n=1 Tax=Streptomyces sp. NPDC090046 TaxID=3365928 RepID=UPI0038021219
MAGQLTTTATDAPLAALCAAGVLERIAARVGREPPGALCETETTPSPDRERRWRSPAR